MKQAFLEKAFWLCGNFPGICRRSYFGQWLICCLQKKGDQDGDNAAKRMAVKRILQYLELPQRDSFENDLIKFVKHFSLRTPMRFRECSSRIEDGTDWGRTFQKSLVETPGRLCSFINYSRKYELDYVTRNSLILLALEMAKELRSFASLIDGLNDKDGSSVTTNCFRQRAKALEELYRDCGRLPQYYNHEHVDYALRHTLDGRRLADNIASWIFIPEWNFKIRNNDHSNAGRLLDELEKNKLLNENNLFEIIAIITSIQVLQEKLGFQIVNCDISEEKPVVKLQKGDLYCRVRKNFDTEDNVKDKLKHYRAIGNSGDLKGYQPDIVYKFWRSNKKSGCKTVYLLGDAKNYECPVTTALHDMMRYLIAFREELAIKDVISFLDGNPSLLDSKHKHQRIVLFFSNPQIDKNGIKNYPQPGAKTKWHPILFVYGPEAKKDPDSNDKNDDALKKFFEAAIKVLAPSSN